MSKTGSLRGRRTHAAPGRHLRSARGLPGRSAILEALIDAGEPLAPEELARRLGIAKRDYAAFAERVDELKRAGEVIVNRKGEVCVIAKLDLVTGTIQGHPDGFGFLVPDEGGDDVFLSPREMRKALHGDRVAAKTIGYDRRGRPEGEIVEVIAHANREVVGRLHEERGIHFIEAENRRVSQDILVPAQDLNGARPGQVVVVEITEQPTEGREALARVKEVLGGATDPGIEIEIALRKHALPFVFAKPAERPAARLPTDVRPADCKGRVDLRALPLVTIDGEDARDFDDAVYRSPKAMGSGSSWRSPTCRLTCTTGMRSIATRVSAARRSTFPGA